MADRPTVFVRPTRRDRFAKSSNFDNISNALRTLSRVRPMIVVIEDLQWADLGTGDSCFISQRDHSTRGYFS